MCLAKIRNFLGVLIYVAGTHYFLAGKVVLKTECVDDVDFAPGPRHVDLVDENHNGYIHQLRPLTGPVHKDIGI